MNLSDLSKHVGVSLIVSLLTALLISLLLIASNSIRVEIVEWLGIPDLIEKALPSEREIGAPALASELLFGIHGSGAGTTDRTFNSVNLLVDANSSDGRGMTGRDQIDWYDASGNSDIRLTSQDKFAVWVFSNALGKEGHAKQNHLTEARFLGTFRAGEQHNTVTLGTVFGQEAKGGRMTALFIAVRVRE